MNVPRRWRRPRNALATLAVVTPLALVAGSQASAGASILRTAQTTSYNTATFLQDDLGFSSSDTSPVIQPVTYDNFQWLLQQSGNSAFLVGDPGEDANFAAEAQQVEASAEADGVKEIYWFDPNLSGGTATSAGTTVGGAVGGNNKVIDEPNLDIRVPANVGALNTAPVTYALNSTAQGAYGASWYWLVSQYLGDGVTATQTSPDTESATVSPSSVTLGVSAAINDSGNTAGDSTEIVNGATNTSGGALYDYTSGSAPATVSDSYFFVYNGANKVSGTSNAEKIVNWVDLDSEFAAGGATQVATDVNAAVSNVGLANLSDYSQFNWWESEADLKQTTAQGSTIDSGNVPLLTDAANSSAGGGWRVDQITYPELIDLLKTDTSQTAVILFGGTWCPNTRPVLPFVNEYAQQNNTEVFNFDTVLDGGTTGGSTTGSANPLQIRNTVSASSTTGQQNTPTFLYGDLVSDYLKNLDTQYDPSRGTGSVTYYPGGVYTSSGASVENKLQVPFLIGYQAADGGGINRQWIINNGDNSYTEYMSSWWDTNPQPNELGLSQIPQDAPIWTTIDAELADATYQTDPATVDADTAIDSDDAGYLDSTDTAVITYTAAGSTFSVTAGSTIPKLKTGQVALGPFAATPSDLSAALASLAGAGELGSASAVPVTLAGAKTDLGAALTATTPNNAEIADLETVVSAWGVAQSRKNSLNNVWGSATSPGSVLGGLAADHALDVFFGGLPGGVISTQTVTASAIDNGAAVQIDVAVANAYGRTPASDVALTLTRGGSTVASRSMAVVNNLATFTVPVAAGGSYGYTVSYAGDDQIAAFTDTGTITVTEPTATSPATATATPTPTATATPAAVVRSKVSRVRGAVSRLATTRTHGRYVVTLATPNGRATATGRVTIKLRKGRVTKTLRAELQLDRATFTLPKLAAGGWKVTISWAGDVNYVAASGSGAAIKVAKK
ncbi:MAG TPA: Ig-like domain-containing protein [Solirubrobacteraceae bacterium]|nr:Ig-like domain-containing protein [Solirubrobacteraceae bacterium]